MALTLRSGRAGALAAGRKVLGVASGAGIACEGAGGVLALRGGASVRPSTGASVMSFLERVGALLL